MNYYQLLIALGLLFLAASFLVMHRTGRIPHRRGETDQLPH